MQRRSARQLLAATAQQHQGAAASQFQHTLSLLQQLPTLFKLHNIVSVTAEAD
jgi:hypothetical protein